MQSALRCSSFATEPKGTAKAMKRFSASRGSRLKLEELPRVQIIST
jgi:hypothetical protein